MKVLRGVNVNSFMLKKIGLGVIGLTLLASPVLASADTLSDLQAQIEALLSQVRALQAQILQVQDGTDTPQVVACTQEAKICPDGSAVGRTGPRCEFAACPGDATNPSPSSGTLCPTLYRTLGRGTSGDDVANLQQFLKDSGVYFSDVTGFFGPLTETAVQRWQASHGVVSDGDASSTGWGVVGARTRSWISQSCGGDVPEAPTVCPAVLRSACPTGQHYQYGSITYDASKCPVQQATCVADVTTTPVAGCPVALRALCPTGYHYEYGAITYDSNRCPIQDAKCVSDVTSLPVCPVVLRSACPAGQHYEYGPTTYDSNRCPVQDAKCVPDTTDASPSVSVTSPSTGTSIAQGSTVTVSWNTQNMPSDAAVGIWLYPKNSAFGSGGGIITSGRPASGTFAWKVPGSACDAAGQCVFIADNPSVWSTEPGSYTIVPKVYTPANVCFGFCPQTPGFKYLATGTAVPITITGPGSGGSGAPVVSGIDGPASLAVWQTGTWTVHASVPQGDSQLSYSVVWGDESDTIYPFSYASSANRVQSSGTFTHAYTTDGTYRPTFTVSNSAGSAQTSASVVVGNGSTICPAIAYQIPICPAGQHVENGKGSSGCPTPPVCVPDTPVACTAVAYPIPVCPIGQHAESRTNNGCPAPSVCVPDSKTCDTSQLIVDCAIGYHPSAGYDSNGCRTVQSCVPDSTTSCTFSGYTWPEGTTGDGCTLTKGTGAVCTNLAVVLPQYICKAGQWSLFPTGASSSGTANTNVANALTALQSALKALLSQFGQ